MAYFDIFMTVATCSLFITGMICEVVLVVKDITEK